MIGTVKAKTEGDADKGALQCARINNLSTSVGVFDNGGLPFYVRNCSANDLTIDVRGMSNAVNDWAVGVVIPSGGIIDVPMLEIKMASGNFPVGIFIERPR